jgi:hypothetical protein
MAQGLEIGGEASKLGRDVGLDQGRIEEREKVGQHGRPHALNTNGIAGGAGSMMVVEEEAFLHAAGGRVGYFGAGC